MLAIVTAATFVLHGTSRAAVGVRRAAGPSAGADASIGLSGTLKLLVLAPADAVARTAAHGFPRCVTAARCCTPLHTAAPSRPCTAAHRCTLTALLSPVPSAGANVTADAGAPLRGGA